jgi:hypothetical protein
MPSEDSDNSRRHNSLTSRPKETSAESLNNFTTPATSRNKHMNGTDMLFEYCESEDLNEKISFHEFCKIKFKKDIPSFAIDLIKYLTDFELFTEYDKNLINYSNTIPVKKLPKFEKYEKQLDKLK